MEVWAEGVKGDAHLEVQSIWAGIQMDHHKKSRKIEETPSFDASQLNKHFLSNSVARSGARIISADTEITLITFDGEPSTTFEFKQTNDPVMVSYLNFYAKWAVKMNYSENETY